MTEKEKMLAGEPYWAMDPELVAERLRAREVLHHFNSAGPDAWDEAAARLGGLFGALGAGTVVTPPFWCDYGSNVRIGANGFLNCGCVFLDCNRITIGDFVQMGPGVHVYTAAHPLDPEARRSGVEHALPITIGHNVWIGGGSILLPGVTIGDNAVVGAGSVVTRDLPANVVAVGNPCRVLRPLDEPRRG
jgi:maltose O-acetyltransferase